jgi:hypothetical protein
MKGGLPNVVLSKIMHFNVAIKINEPLPMNSPFYRIMPSICKFNIKITIEKRMINGKAKRWCTLCWFNHSPQITSKHLSSGMRLFKKLLQEASMFARTLGGGQHEVAMRKV